MYYKVERMNYLIVHLYLKVSTPNSRVFCRPQPRKLAARSAEIRACKVRAGADGVGVGNAERVKRAKRLRRGERPFVFGIALSASYSTSLQAADESAEGTRASMATRKLASANFDGFYIKKTLGVGCSGRHRKNRTKVLSASNQFPLFARL